MSVPHLDARVIDGKRALLFGPFAGFTTKFLKKGSIFDLFGSIKPSNLKPMLSVAFDNMDLTGYLVKGALQSHKDRMASLLGASPGASISVQAMIEVLGRCFKKRMHSAGWSASYRK